MKKNSSSKKNSLSHQLHSSLLPLISKILLKIFFHDEFFGNYHHQSFDEMSILKLSFFFPKKKPTKSQAIFLRFGFHLAQFKQNNMHLYE